MATEPERNIEKQLKAYADKRRTEAGAPLELHPATRNMLQSEVARVIPKRSPRQGSFLSQLFAGLWPRIALGVSVFAVLLVGTWMLWQTQNQTTKSLELGETISVVQSADQIADNILTPKPTLAAPPAEQPLSLAAAPSNEPQQLEKSAVDKTLVERLGGRDVGPGKKPAGSGGESSTQTIAPAAAPPLADGRVAVNANNPRTDSSLTPSDVLAESESAKKQLAARSLTAPAPASAPSPLPATKITPPAQAFYTATELEQKSVNELSRATVNQRFAQVVPVAKGGVASRSSNANVVLTSFQMELAPWNSSGDTSQSARWADSTGQGGNQVRVIDRDGSTYAGFLQIADTSLKQKDADGKATASNRERKAKMAAKVDVFKTGVKSELQAEQDYFFRVEGTNRSLNQRVVFSGHLLANVSNADAYKTNVSTTATGQLQLPLQNQLPPLLLNSRINGTALIGGSKTLEIQALPVNP
ncbi:MAG: hypothetical protein HY298_02735 [Verrucomicrobia bacterium]|nr:hypothetical protein [Verrucomicrobiota bacterium]